MTMLTRATTPTAYRTISMGSGTIYSLHPNQDNALVNLVRIRTKPAHKKGPAGETGLSSVTWGNVAIGKSPRWAPWKGHRIQYGREPSKEELDQRPMRGRRRKGSERPSSLRSSLLGCLGQLRQHRLFERGGSSTVQAFSGDPAVCAVQQPEFTAAAVRAHELHGPISHLVAVPVRRAHAVWGLRGWCP